MLIRVGNIPTHDLQNAMYEPIAYDRIAKPGVIPSMPPPYEPPATAPARAAPSSANLPFGLRRDYADVDSMSPSTRRCACKLFF
jgi:hypothetical protein